MTNNKCTKELEQFREKLYQNFNNQADTLMELVDAICSNPNARSVVEYSLTPCFRRSYSTIFKAIDKIEWDKLKTSQLLAPYLPSPKEQDFWLLGTDVTSQRRQFARTLTDRGMVYEANPIKGNKPVTIGHQYSTTSLLLEEEEGIAKHWLIPLMVERVPTNEDKELVGSDQIKELLKDPILPFGKKLCVHVADTHYAKPACLHANAQHENLVTIARARSNRVFYQSVGKSESDKNPVGHPTWYGDRFSLKDETTWHEADEAFTLTEKSCRGKEYRIEIQAWHNMLMRGKYKPKQLPMQNYPFTLVRVVRYNQDSKQIGKHPLWLIVMGQSRQQLCAKQSYQAYTKRYNLEHFFRFGKQKLLLASFQTPDTIRSEKWWQLVHLAYAQLWLARSVAHALPRPWERNLPQMKTPLISPALVQRDFGRIIRQIGTPAQMPKPRGISLGRATGTKLPPRPRPLVVVKGKKTTKPP